MLRISVRREAHRAHRLDVNVESPTGTSCSDPHGAHVLLEVHADSPTSNLKLKLADIWPEFASEATVLVHCGRVLGDWKPLADYRCQLRWTSPTAFSLICFCLPSFSSCHASASLPSKCCYR